MSDDITKITTANKAAWEASAALHGTGPAWDALVADAAKPGFSVLDEELTSTLKALNIQGKRAVQIGCNNARELLSLAALGAVPALGIDQSQGFLDQGQKLAKAAGLTPRLQQADIYALPADIGQYDLALITIGVLNWMPDLAKFFEAVAGLMAEGAVLVIYETHPFMEMFDYEAPEPHRPSFSYFKSTPEEVNDAITYDGVDHGKGETGYWFIHTLGSIVTACAQAGLRIENLTEFARSIREPEYDIYSDQAAQIPMSFKLVARK